MPTKTDRILGYLPGTFRALPRPTALYSVVDAFGNELLQAENSLAALMQAHWVDLADRNEEMINDLARIASLYGLAPRDDESVEEFREHLKRYVRTFLEGTVTVQGIFRVVAEVLGLHIADGYDDMDTWWMRPRNLLITPVSRGDDAASVLLGVNAARVTGSPSLAARVVGLPNLAAGADLRAGSVLTWVMDGGGPVILDLKTQVANLAAATLQEITAAINSAAGSPIASHDGRHLIMASPTLGVPSRLEIRDADDDAAPILLGLPSRTVHGRAATSAHVTGMVDLNAGVDLHDSRYLRLFIDTTNLVEFDCAGPVPAATSLDQVRDAINGAIGATIASHDGHYLTLKSTKLGTGSSIAFQSPATQDATQLLFGSVATVYTGSDAQPARLVGLADLRHGVDLGASPNLRLRIDGNAVTVNCAGADPSHTQAIEVVAAINAALHAPVASLAGHGISVASVKIGSSGEVGLEPPLTGDASLLVLGIPPRIFTGSAATAARLVGTHDLTQHQDPSGKTATGVDLGAVHLLQISIDGGPPLVADARRVAQNPRAVTLVEIASALNAAAGFGIASSDGQHLILTSPTAGAASSMEIVPLETALPRRFLTRAFITDEAAQAIFGFLRARATSSMAAQARVEGILDLGRGVDLRQARFLRVGVDGAPPTDIDCADQSARPRVALIGEIVAAINAKLGSDVASSDGHHLFLTSPTTGALSRIELGVARGTDALDKLLGSGPLSVRGTEGTRVIFKGTVDLSGGVDLSAVAKVKIGVDSAAPVEFACAGAIPANSKLNEIITAINVALGATIATSDGKRLILTSPTVGINSRLEFATPSGSDATARLFGITAPRSYHGSDPTPARVVGTRALGAPVDLTTVRFLRIAVDGGAPVDVDCVKSAADPAHATLVEIEKSINTALGKNVAGDDGAHLILTSIAAGSAGQLALQAYTASDARSLLLGVVPDVTTGSDAAPPVMTGGVDLRAGVNLEERRTLLLSINGGRPVEIDVAGAAPHQTFPDEIADKINAVFPGLASVTADNFLRLTAPVNGENSSVELLPLRALELIEYPPEAVDEPPRAVRHGDSWSMVNDGAADSDLEIEITAAQGQGGIGLVDLTAGLRVRVMTTLEPGERLRIRRDTHAGLVAEVLAMDGAATAVPGSQILTGPLGTQAWVPFTGSWHFTGGSADDWASLQLNNPDASSLVVLRARQRGASGDSIACSVVEAAVPAGVVVPVAGTSKVRLMGKLVSGAGGTSLKDGSGKILAVLRPGSNTALDAYSDKIVTAEGQLFAGEGISPILVVESIAMLFDVTVTGTALDGTPLVETYAGVTIGGDSSASDSLMWQVNSGMSQLVIAEELDKGAALNLPRGRSKWIYLNFNEARFNRDLFDEAHFAAGICREGGIFDVSRFTNSPPEPEVAVFSPTPPLDDPTVDVRFHWVRCQAGAFVVNLPADLPEEFGARFDQGRFAVQGNSPEIFPDVVLEASVLSGPGGDPDYLVNRINTSSKLVTAKSLTQPNPPLGWETMTVPFRHPRAQPLTLGNDTSPGKMYLAENGVAGLIELSARQPGVWGNSIEVTARPAGPARYDVTIGLAAARFESARQIAWAGHLTPPGDDPLPALISEILRPQPVGVLHAKAAGVRAVVTRDRADAEPLPRPAGEGPGGAPRSTYLLFDGFSSYVEVPDSPALSVATTGALTVSVWMRPDSLKFPRTDGSGYVNWLGKGQGSGAQGKQEWTFRIYSQGNSENRQNRISFYVFNPEGGKGVGSYFQDLIAAGEWIHVVGVADGKNTSIYKNGLFRKCDQYATTGDGSCESHAPLAITPVHGGAPFRMGHRDANSYFLGGLAKIRIWNRPLSKVEIAGLYALGVVPLGGLVAEYLLNEGQGTRAHDTKGGNDGTIFGATWKSASPEP